MAELLDGFVRDLPTEFKDKILERSEGVPLYAVETVRMLADKGVLAQDEGAYHLAGETGSLEIPDTLHALIASRLDTLSMEQRSLLEDASVVGRTFTTASLGRGARWGPRTAWRPISATSSEGSSSHSTATPALPSGASTASCRDSSREVAYATLSRRDRSAKHLALARHLESLADDELTSVVAAHYVEAHRAAPEGPGADLIAAAARDWLARAGRRALSLGSPEQALSFFEQALEVTTSGAERAALLELAGEAADRASTYDQAVLLLEEAIAYYEATGDTNAVGRFDGEVGPVLGIGLSRYAEAISGAERVFHAVGDDGDEHVRAKLACELALAHSNSGSSERALEWSETALVLAERLDDIDAARTDDRCQVVCAVQPRPSP